MSNRSHHIHALTRKPWALLIVGVAVAALSYGTTHAALLDGLLEPVTEKLGEKASEKGETVTTGNFYPPEVPDAHAPIGMMGDHTHNQGEFMFTYRFMQMEMDGNLDGTSKVTDQDVVSPSGYGFIVTPTDMYTQMHMFSGMWGVNNTVTLMLGAPYILKSMNHLTRPGGRFKTESEGWGDIKLTSLWRLYAVEAPSIGSHAFHGNLGLSFPTGSIDQKDQNPMSMGNNVQLPYPMQLGSGTFDLLLGLTYRGASDKISWGFQPKGVIRLGRNDNGYSLGDGFDIGGFGAYRWAEWLSTSLRANWKVWYNIDGKDSKLPPGFDQVNPAADPDRRGGQRFDIFGGFNILFPEYRGLENRLAFEIGAPVYQYLDGPQLETDWTILAGYQAVY